MYAELSVTTNFSFLRGASHPEELVERATQLGLKAIAITDYNSLAGIARAHVAAKENGLQLIVGARLTPVDGPNLLVYPLTRRGYGNLCRLLTLGNRRSIKGACELALADCLAHLSELAVIAVPPVFQPDMLETQCASFGEACKQILKTLGDKNLLSIALTRSYSYNAKSCGRVALELASKLRIETVAVNDVHYHIPERRVLQDVLSCIRNKTTLQSAGVVLLQNAERFLKPPAEMVRLFRDCPRAIKRTLEIAELAACFSLEQLKYEYPDEVCPPGRTAKDYLHELTWQGAGERYPQGVPEMVKELIDQELKLIHELSYEKYFLTCYDIVRFARSRGILCQGRGAAANSAVCFCLEITAVDPVRINLLFARFVSKERDEPPDIDIDFEHERREEVIQYLYRKYGRERAGLTAEVITYRERSAIRDVGKVFGLSLPVIDKLAKSVHRWTGSALNIEDLKLAGVEPDSIAIRNALQIASELVGFPRHLSQHVGGFIISQKPLCETVPILNAAMPERTIIEWDKNDIEALGMLKIDILGLGMLSCLRKTLELVNKGHPFISLHSIPPEDPAVYEMICRADTIGVFQIESRAQMSMLPRLKPRCFYDLVIEVAIVRPGPIQGNMVHPYLKRRNGLEKVYFPDSRVEQILGKTLGVPLFQEQAMRLAIVLANFSPGEAERLRRAMAAWKRNKELIATFSRRIMAGMAANGYSPEFAASCIQQIKGFSEYGFPESHAASFALLVYASAWLKHYYPAEFAASLLNSQPMGFYAPSQIIRDSQNHAVNVLPIDINHSLWDTQMIAGDLRLGFHLVRGLARQQIDILLQARNWGPFPSLRDLWQRVFQINKATLRTLAKADAFGSIGLTSRQAFWEIRALPQQVTPFDVSLKEVSPQVKLPLLTKKHAMFQDYVSTGFSLRAHPIEFIRPELEKRKVKTASALKSLAVPSSNIKIWVAGVVIFRQRPGTAKGVLFVTLEDETGITNLVVQPRFFEKFRHILLSSSSLLAYGILERSNEVVYINALYLESLDILIMGTTNSPLPCRSWSY